MAARKRKVTLALVKKRLRRGIKVYRISTYQNHAFKIIYIQVPYALRGVTILSYYPGMTWNNFLSEREATPNEIERHVRDIIIHRKITVREGVPCYVTKNDFARIKVYSES